MTGIGNVLRGVIGLTVLAMVGCGESPTEPPFPYVEGDPAVRRIAWEARGITDYDYHLAYVADFTVPIVRVEVRGGVVVRLVELEGGAIITGTDHPAWRTVDDLFDEAVAAYAVPEHVLFLTFDASLDYLRELSVDPSMMEDDAWGYIASQLVVH